jgi:hypothetical protein
MLLCLSASPFKKEGGSCENPSPEYAEAKTIRASRVHP